MAKRQYQYCELCGKKHQYIKMVWIEYQGQKLEVEEIHSPCLDALARKAVSIVG